MYVAHLAMIFIITLSNYLVQFPINEWLTWGAFSYPLSFLVTELTTRFYGPKKARYAVYVGFFVALFISFIIATPKIALASVTAFLVAQLLDISLFSRFRQGRWWQAPFLASLGASSVDTALFWTIAFFGEPVPLLTWALGDLGVKILLDAALLVPFRLAMRLDTFLPLVLARGKASDSRSV